MTLQTILAAGNTAATSADVTLAENESATIGIFSPASDSLPKGLRFYLTVATPGADNVVDTLDTHQRQIIVSGPGTYRVSRPAYDGVAFGAFVYANV